jgi:ABC-type Fe3+-hydroxamate transport system substrate-binding protein
MMTRMPGPGSTSIVTPASTSTPPTTDTAIRFELLATNRTTSMGLGTPDTVTTVASCPLVRVVSLVPSITETLLAWGIEPVACTRFCEQPSFTHVGGTKDPDVEAITTLAPDLVLMNDEENRLEDHETLVAAGLDVHVVRINAVDDVVPALRALAERVDVDFTPFELAPPRPPVRRAFVPIWRRPWMTIGAGTYGSSVLAHVGVVNVFAEHARYPEITLDDAATRAPDVILAPSEPYPVRERHRAELEAVAPVVFIDGQDLFWWGARTPAAIRRLQDALAR